MSENTSPLGSGAHTTLNSIITPNSLAPVCQCPYINPFHLVIWIGALLRSGVRLAGGIFVCVQLVVRTATQHQLKTQQKNKYISYIYLLIYLRD